MPDATILAQLYADPILAFRVLLPHWFPRKMPWVHRGIVAILLRRTDFLLNFGKESWADEEAEWTEADLDKIIQWFVWEHADGTKEPLFAKRYDERKALVAVDLRIGQHTCIMMPRGFAKTTLTNAVNIFKVLFKLTKFTLMVSETAGHAAKQLDNIKAELEANERILELFGSVKPDRNSSLRWTQEEFETTTEVFFTARGRGGQVRGLNNKGARPDTVNVDDLEDEESVSTPEQRDKCLTWFMSSLLPVIPRLDRSATFTVMGTLLHREALLTKLASDEDWTFIRFGAKLPDGSWLWPENMDEAGWEATRRSFASKGKANRFYMEFASEARDDDAAKFKTEYFNSIIEPIDPESCIARAIVIDPAISDKIGADRTAIAVVGITAKGLIHVLDVWGRVGADPREQVDKYFELASRWDCTRHGVEAIAYQAALIHLLREEMFRRHRYFEIEPIRHSTKKTERIEGVLQPRYAARYIRHQRDFPVLLQQLLDWPNGGFDDADAVAMAVTLLDPFAALAADPSKDPFEDEYEPLEKVVRGSVRHAP